MRFDAVVDHDDLGRLWTVLRIQSEQQVL